MIEITLSIVLQIVQTVGILVGIFYYVTVMRNAQRNQQQQLETRQLQGFMQVMSMALTRDGLMYGNIFGRTNVSNYDEFREKMDNDAEYRSAFVFCAWLYESIGVILKEGLVGVRLLALYDAIGTIQAWERYKEIIYELRKRSNNKRRWGMWEYTYNTLMRYLDEHPELKP